LVGKLAELVGEPITMTLRTLPAPVTAQINRAVSAAMYQALKVAVHKMDARPILEPGRVGFQVISGITGSVSGFFGLPALAVELPVTTTLMLRSIAGIASQEGEDLNSASARIACLEVFALGGKGAPTSETTYYATRAFLARTANEAARAVAERTAASGSGPVIVELIAKIAGRFGIVVSEKVAAQAVPVVGAIGGAAVNLAFMEHFQRLAAAHFAIRRLERTYGKELIRAQYQEYVPSMRASVSVRKS
jgi:hypothetical protein